MATRGSVVVRGGAWWRVMAWWWWPSALVRSATVTCGTPAQQEAEGELGGAAPEARELQPAALAAHAARPLHGRVVVEDEVDAQMAKSPAERHAQHRAQGRGGVWVPRRHLASQPPHLDDSEEQQQHGHDGPV